MKKIVFLSAAIAMTLGIQTEAHAQAITVQTANTRSCIPFEGRQVEISPFFESFPYQYFTMSRDGQKLFFTKTGIENRLQWIPLDGQTQLADGHDAIDANLSARNAWSPTYNDADGYMYWIGDEHNDEKVDLWRSRLEPLGQPERLTDVPYIYAWHFNQAKDKIAYVSRMGQEAQRRDELHILDLKTLQDTHICDDREDFRYTWGTVSWRPDGKGLLLLALKGQDRQYCNVLYVDVEQKTSTVITNPELKASYAGCDLMDEWINDTECFFFSDQDGYKNLYHFDSQTMKVEQKTFFRQDLEQVEFVTIKDKKYLFGLRQTPVEATLMLMDAATCQVIYEQTSPMNISLGSARGDKVRLIAQNTTTIVEVQEVTVGRKKMQTQTLFALPQEVTDQLVYTDVESLFIPTFDIDPATGEQRLIHAYLFKPKNPLPADKGCVMLESFYGGDNRYTDEYQIYGKAGIYVLSASSRGNAGFGRDFAALNDKDLGGNEIIDIIYCAKYISERLGIPAERVGCFGVSHGGYATMRLMTFPGEVNGNKASFPFGFGVETAGFCDIIHQHLYSNIPDWTELEAGNPIRDKAKIVDRSPLYWADKITGPLLLVHGNHDNRVEMEGSRLMDRMLIHLGKPHRYVEYEGLGHGVKGKAYNYDFYNQTFKFIEDVIEHRPVE